MVRLTELVVGGNLDAWSSIGLPVHTSNAYAFDVVIQVRDHLSGLISCSFSDSRVTDSPSPIHSIDGLPMQLNEPSDTTPMPSFIERGTLASVAFIGIDHVVITTDDLARTSEAIESVLGAPCARTRDAGHSVTQAFHKLDNTILELVTGPHVKHSGANWWGFVLTVKDIDLWWKQVGESVATPPRDAVQQGRKISTIHSSVDLGVAVAVMSPHIRIS